MDESKKKSSLLQNQGVKINYTLTPITYYDFMEKL